MVVPRTFFIVADIGLECGALPISHLSTVTAIPPDLHEVGVSIMVRSDRTPC